MSCFVYGGLFVVREIVLPLIRRDAIITIKEVIGPMMYQYSKYTKRKRKHAKSYREMDIIIQGA